MWDEYYSYGGNDLLERVERDYYYDDTFESVFSCDVSYYYYNSNGDLESVVNMDANDQIQYETDYYYGSGE